MHFLDGCFPKLIHFKAQECLAHIKQQLVYFADIEDLYLQIKIAQNENLRGFLEIEIRKMTANDCTFLPSYINHFS